MADQLAKYAGVEIGEMGAWIAITFGAADGPLSRWRARFTTAPAIDEIVTRIADGLRELRAGAEIAAIGVAVWDTQKPTRGASSIVGVDAAELAARLEVLTGAPTRVQGAIEAAAQAEAHMGAGQDADPLVYIHLGREVRDAIVSHGRALHGAHSQGGQIGHWRVAERGPRCSCGQVGHLNPLCSSQGFVRLAIGAIAQDEVALAAANAATGGRVETITARQVIALARERPAALEPLIAEAARALSVALANLTLLIDPTVIVLGGPLGAAGGAFLEQVQEGVSERLRAVAAGWRAPAIEPARLEPHSALTGAWLLACAPGSESA